MNSMDYTKTKELLQDEAFVTKMRQQTEPEGAQALLAEKGIDMTIDELMEMHELMERYEKGELTDEEQRMISIVQKDYNGEELTEEELALVSGGMSEGTSIGLIVFGLIGLIGLMFW